MFRLRFWAQFRKRLDVQFNRIFYILQSFLIGVALGMTTLKVRTVDKIAVLILLNYYRKIVYLHVYTVPNLFVPFKYLKRVLTETNEKDGNNRKKDKIDFTFRKFLTKKYPSNKSSNYCIEGVQSSNEGKWAD